MRLRRSLRLRITLGLALFSLLIVSAHSVAIFLVTDEQEEGLIDRIVSEEMEHFIREYRQNAKVPPPRMHNLSGYIVRDEQGRAALPSYLRDLAVGVHEIEIGDGELHVAVRALNGTRLYLTYDASHHEVRMREFKWLLVFGVMATALLSTWLGYMLAGLLMKPVSDLERQVAGLAPGTPGASLADGYVDEEVKRLALAFDGYLRKMSDLVEREREFTANVSHELRTPLTTIQTSGELLAQDATLSAASRARLEKILRASHGMSELIRSLLFLARERQPAAVEPVHLRELVDETTETCRDRLANKPVKLRIEIDPKVVLTVDRGALQLVLTNLIDNAISHTEHGHVAVHYRDNRLTVEDSGCGISEHELPHIFQRFYRGHRAGHQGFGLGLAIVKRIADLYGWRLTMASRAGVGTRITVEFCG